LKLKGTQINAFISLVVSEEELVKRLLNRGLTSGRSDDTNEDVIRARITEYKNKTSIVADYYKQFDKFTEVKGEGSIDNIFNALCKEIDSHM
jgi:adenylate kinase